MRKPKMPTTQAYGETGLPGSPPSQAHRPAPEASGRKPSSLARKSAMLWWLLQTSWYPRRRVAISSWVSSMRVSASRSLALEDAGGPRRPQQHGADRAAAVAGVGEAVPGADAESAVAIEHAVAPRALVNDAVVAARIGKFGESR